MNLKLFSQVSSTLEIAGSEQTLSKPPASDQDKVVLHMAELEKTMWIYIPILLVLGFAIGFMIGRHGRIWRTFQEKEPDHATQNRAGNSQNNSANDMGSPDDNSDTEETKTENMNTEGSQHELYFGKAKIPVAANPEHIITEMSKMILREGEHKGRTFQQVWSIDRKMGYTKWLKARIASIDIAYIAFVIYADMKDVLQR